MIQFFFFLDKKIQNPVKIYKNAFWLNGEASTALSAELVVFLRKLASLRCDVSISPEDSIHLDAKIASCQGQLHCVYPLNCEISV